jgi:hypothetical protein
MYFSFKLLLRLCWLEREVEGDVAEDKLINKELK